MQTLTRLDRAIYQTARGKLTDDPSKAAFLVAPKGREVTTALLRAHPDLKKFVEKPPDKRVKTPANKGAANG